MIYCKKTIRFVNIEPKLMKKIFITGGLGFIGSKLAMQALAKGFSVFLYDSLIYKQDYRKIMADIEKAKTGNATVEYIIGDTRNTKLIEKSLKDFNPDFLFHFAELAGIYVCNDNPTFTEDINFEASKNVLDLAEKLKIPTIYNSSSSVYGNQKDLALLDEDSLLPEPTDNYCKYKLKMEKYVEDKIKTNPKFKIIVLRPATIWGVSPRMRLELLPNHFTYCALKGLVKISEPEAYRAEIDIDDMIDCYFKIMEKNNWPRLVYNVGHHNLKKIEVAKIIQSIVNCKIEPIGNLGDSRNLQIDSSAFSKDFNWKPKYSFEDTVKKMKKWLEVNIKEIEKSNYSGIINTPLSEWLKII